METLIRLDAGDGPLVEVDVDVPAAQRASAGMVFQIVNKGFDDIITTLRSIVVPLTQVWRELSKEVEISESTVKLSLGVTGEGQFFVAKGSAKANLDVEIKLKPRPLA